MGMRLVLMMVLTWVSAAAAAEGPVPTFESLRQSYRASDVRVLDRSGAPLQRVRTDHQGRRGDWLSLDSISPALVQAVVESEDRRFYQHHGVDGLAVAAAAWATLSGSGRRGASTLTMQLAGLIENRHRRPDRGRGLVQKLDQAIYAQALERRWSKDQILEAYLNLVPFRGELVGADALSRVLFRKHASGLDARESAIAAVMLRGPNVSAETLSRRACALLARTREGADCFDMQWFVQARLANQASPRFDHNELAPHFARWAVAQASPEPGESLRTSIDGTLQREVLRIVDRRLHELVASHVRDVAVVVLDNASGQVLAYVGSSGGWSDAAWVDHARALRQAGSTLKPFLYQQAIEQLRLTAVSLLDDGPLNLPTGNGLYIPRNYDERYSGWVSVRTALGSSLNIPAVRALTLVTTDDFRQRLVQLGLPLEHAGDYYGYSLALGSADVSLVSLTNAYRTLANLGRYSPVRLDLAGETAARQVMDAGASWIVGDILSDAQARARTFGLDSPLTTPFWTAVKTGTSKDMRDNWTIGWSSRYTVGVWAGNSGGESMRDVSGVTGAGPIWHDVMVYLNGMRGSSPPRVPDAVRAGQVEFEGGIEPARLDYFVGDTLLAQVRPAASAQGGLRDVARIVSPQDGTVLALDPDIPPRNQRVLFRASGAGALAEDSVVWRIDGEGAQQGREMLWLPKPGRHQVELLGGEGEVLDSLTLTVRGAVLAAPGAEDDYLACADTTSSC